MFSSIKPNSEGFVYFARAGDGPVKIGWSSSPKARRNLNCPVTSKQARIFASFPGTPGEEAFVQGVLSPFRLSLRGGASGFTEWFEPSPDVMAFAECGVDMIAAIRLATLALAADIRAKRVSVA